MTDRQIVLKKYPDAKLEYHVMPRNTLNSFCYYTIETNDKRLSRSATRYGAWKIARKQTQKLKP